MNTLIFKPILLLFFLCGFFPLIGYSDTVVDEDSKLVMDKSCVTNARDNLIIKFPNINPQDINSISLYACSCAYKDSQKNSIPAEATDFRNVKNCIYYGVLRNAIKYKAENEIQNSEVLKKCISTFPHDLTDDSVSEDIANFCKCAATPTEKIADEITPSKLNEDQIYDQLIKVINGCRYSI